MITPEQIPRAAAIAATRDGLSSDDVREIVANAINAWEGSYSLAENDSAIIRDVAVIILPLPTEASDE